MKGLCGEGRATVRLAGVVGVALAVIGLSSVGAARAGATTLPSGYQETVVFSGLVNPTVVRFSSDGRVFVAEKSGLIKVFDNLTDTTPTVFADLRTNVHNFWDRGLLGMALAPGFPADPSVYVLYTYDAAIGGTAPRWGIVGSDSDGCPSPPGATSDGCVVSGRLSRLQANGNVMTGPEHVLIEDWCQQYPSHSVGSLAFGADGALYASGGDGASFGFADYGQDGSPLNPCGDPPGGVGGAMTAPTAEGGALRSQDVRSTTDPAGLNGSIIRVDPATGAGLPDNPLAFSPDPNARRVIAHGFRNPFRITVKPGTSDVWVGDVGWGDWEEIDVVRSQPDMVADNYGWPCYEGTSPQGGYDSANLALCESLYAQPAGLFAPLFAYNHAAAVVPGESCPTGSSSIAGTAFETGSNFPVADDGALFFADYSRDCIWRMRVGSSGAPDPATVSTFAAGAANPVDLVFGPDGALYYPDFDAGTVRRISFTGDTTPPTVSILTPAPGATASGSVTVSATAGDNVGVVSVQFKVDGANVSGELTSPPYSFAWNTTSTANGSHVLTATTRDASSNVTTSAPVSVLVSNAVGSARFVSDLPVVSEANGYGPVEFDRSNGEALAGDGGPLMVNGVGFAKGLGVHAGSDVVYAVPAGCTSFASQVGVDDEVGGSGSVVFEVWVDGTRRASSPRLTGADNAVALAADVTGASQLRLVVQNGGDNFDYDHADWGDARFVCGGGQANQPPTAIASGSPLTGVVPLAVGFDGSGSSDPDPGDVLTYAWDLDGDGQFDDATVAKPSWTYTTAATIAVRLQTSDGHGHTTTSAPVTVTPGSTAPSVSITSPTVGTTWKVGDPISFSATGTDALGAQLPGTAFDWVVLIQHCPSNCHTHTYQTFDNTASGSFPAPDHEYPSYIELRVTATDADGKTATASLDVQPRTVDLTFATSPPGLSLAVGAEVVAAPFTRSVIVGSTNSISAVTPQFLAIASYGFVSWSDNGGATHNITAPATATTYTATYVADKIPPTVSVTAPTNGSTVSGAVTLQATASDAGGIAGVQFKLDGANLGTEDTSSPYQVPWDSTTASSGPHTLTAVARDASGNTATSAPIGVTVQNVTACPTGRWKAEYFTNRTLAGTPTVTRCENAIANDWGSGSPVTGIGADNFSVRWTGRFPFPAGPTTFFVTADDGIRLRVDGALAIDQWKDQSATTYRSRQTLAVGDHDVSIEYYEKTSSAVAKASWRSSLVAAYTFNESSGSSVIDGSANGNTGTITGASRTSSGKYGRALTFNGTSNWVTVADAGVLDLSTQMTVEAWVYPTSLGSASRSVVVKEAAATLSYGLDAHRSSLPVGRVNTGTVQGIQASVSLATKTWTHLTVTYNGALLRFYVNGMLVASRSASGTIVPSTGVLRIGGSNVASEWFAGRIDDVRLYARALEQSEIQADMAAELP